ncbi:MAG: GNAT family N-acetyltransferase [Saprospiraceae bacterium]|nr:GNAT family N-acetyltransferase [Saprospiraceae bacterium]
MYLYCEEIEFATPEFDEAVRLRDKILRKPLGLQFTPEDIATEYDSIHLGCYTANNDLAAVLTLKPVSQKTVKMRQVAVDDALQNMGVGKFLVLQSEKLARFKGFERIELHARLTAVPFYESLQYLQSGDIFKEVGIDHVFMYKNLKD